jgi:hypothetical protein
MKKLNPIEFQTGFLMGIVLGVISEGAFIFIYNGILSKLFEWPPIDLSFWYLIPVPLIFGIAMGFTIANLHLEDY